MMKNILALLSIFCLPFFAAAQDFAVFSKQLSADSTFSLSGEPVELPSGDILSVGFVVEGGINKGVLARLDEHGQLLWAKTYSGGVIDRFYGMSAALDSAVYVFGDTRSYGTGGDEMLITKIDWDGNVLWTRVFGGSTGDDRARSAYTCANGDLIIGGMFFGLGAGSSNLAFLRLDSDGNLVSKKMHGSSTADYTYFIKEISPNRIIMAGSRFSSSANMDFMLSMLDSMGNAIWHKTYDNASATDEWERYLGGAWMDNNGDMYFVVRPGGTGSNAWNDSTDLALFKIDSSGNLLSAVRYPMPGMDRNGTLLKTGSGFMMMAASNNFTPTTRSLLFETDNSGIPTSAYIQNNDYKSISNNTTVSAAGGYVAIGNDGIDSWVQHLDNDFMSCLPLGDSVSIPYQTMNINSATPAVVSADTGVLLSVSFTQLGNLILNDSMYCYFCETPQPDFSSTLNGDTLIFTQLITGNFDSLSWDFGDGSGSVSENPVHVYSSPGAYNVCLTAFNYCGSASYCETVNVISAMNTKNYEEQIRVFPNPSNGLFQLQLPNQPELGIMRIMDALGRNIDIKILNTASQQLDLSALPSGNYWLHFLAFNHVIQIQKQ